ncbi:hypothetical protein [Streptomyces sp. NBC_01538]
MTRTREAPVFRPEAQAELRKLPRELVVWVVHVGHRSTVYDT